MMAATVVASRQLNIHNHKPVLKQSHGASASHGPMLQALGRVWQRHGWFPCLGRRMEECKKIERKWCIGLSWPRFKKIDTTN